MNGRGGGGESDPFFFLPQNFWGQFSRHRVAVADPGFQKKGGGGAGSFHAHLAHRAPHTGGVEGQSPCRGPRGRSTRRLSSFQQIYKGLQDGRQER